jgi:hypothetical protein
MIVPNSWKFGKTSAHVCVCVCVCVCGVWCVVCGVWVCGCRCVCVCVSVRRVVSCRVVSCRAVCVPCVCDALKCCRLRMHLLEAEVRSGFALMCLLILCLLLAILCLLVCGPGTGMSGHKRSVAPGRQTITTSHRRGCQSTQIHQTKKIFKYKESEDPRAHLNTWAFLRHERLTSREAIIGESSKKF